MNRMKKAAVKMCNIIKEVRHHMPESFFWHYVFLPAVLAIRSLYNGAAIQAIFLCPVRNMGHCKILLKNKDKKIQDVILFRY